MRLLACQSEPVESAAEHIPVLLAEVLDSLLQSPSGVYVDATFGRGGHTRALLQRLDGTARLVAMDRDPQAVAAGRGLAAEDPRLLIRHASFAQLREVLAALGISLVEGVLMDLGVSSPQLDDPTRGFSFRASGPLDMRMDTTAGATAAEWLNSAAEEDIARVIFEHGEERFARRIARRIVAGRPLRTTAQLAELVQAAVPARFHGGKHPATKTFQAVRIHINQEDQQLRLGLQAAFAALAVHGRLAVITFHSLEDRVVKQTFRDLSRPPQLPRRVPVRESQRQAPGRLVGGPRTPGAAEIEANPRARSAKLRVLEKTALAQAD